MPFITLGAILTVLKTGGAHVFDRRNDPAFWSVDIEPDGGEKRKGEVTGVSVEATGLMLTVIDKGVDLALSAVPRSVGKTKILVNGEVDSDAAMIFDPKPSLGNLT